MVSRKDILSKAVDDCVKDIYSIAQPQVDWEDFKEQCKIYSKSYFEWEEYRKAKENNPKLYKEYNERLGWEGKNITECIGPRPYEFYYVPSKVQKEIVDSYIYAYRIDSQQELLDTIQILKNYCKEPIVDKYIDDWDDEYGHHPGYRGYEHPDNLKKELSDILDDDIGNAFQSNKEIEEISTKLQNKFFEFLDMAGNFYNWNSELSSFNMSVYMGITPSTNKETVIDNWKQYRNKDIEIDESKFEEEDE